MASINKHDEKPLPQRLIPSSSLQLKQIQNRQRKAAAKEKKERNLSINPSQQLSASENRPSKCFQLRDLADLRAKQLLGSGYCAAVAMIAFPIFFALNFFFIKQTAKTKYFPNHSLEKLKHPVFQTAYLDLETDEFEARFDTTLYQQEKYEGFFQFNNWTNVEKVIEDENGDVMETVRQYNPSFDPTGPNNWLPQQCYASVDYKYTSPVIAYIKNGNRLEEDLLTQIKSIMREQTHIQKMADKLEIFLATVTIPGSDPAAEDEDGEVEEAEEPELDDRNVFKLDPDLLSTAGGGPINPHEPDPSAMGYFVYKEYDSVDEIFEYTTQEGYGWDPEIPAICFGFQVLENEDQTRYEIEWLYRDQWPLMYATMLRTDLEITPIDTNPILLGYSRAAYNGINMMQIFAANSILQRRFNDPDAEIMMFTIPYKIPTTETSPIKVAAKIFSGLYFMLTLVPLVFYMVYAVAKDKESGMHQLLIANGLKVSMNFASWLIHYTILNVLITMLYVISMKSVLYEDDSFFLFVMMTFFAIQSFFGVVWFLQGFIESPRVGIFATAFFFFLSFYATFTVSQKSPQIEPERKQMLSVLSPLTAATLSYDVLTRLHLIGWAMNFDNWDQVDRGWSLKKGVEISILNFFLWTAAGIAVDLVMNHSSSVLVCDRFARKREVKCFNTNEDTLEISGLKERGVSKGTIAPQYDFILEKSTICALVGSNQTQMTKLLEMIAGRRSCVPGGNILVRDSDFFARGPEPNIEEYLVYSSSNLVLDDGSTAQDHLNVFSHLRGKQKSHITKTLCNKLLPFKTRVGLYSESQRQCLQTLIALSSDNSRIVLLDEPTRGLGGEQRSEMIKALQKYKKDRYLIIQSADILLVNVLADSVAKVLPTGIKVIKNSQLDEEESGDYRLVVEHVQNNTSESQSENLLRYLWKDVPQLALEYQTEKISYYILPNMSKALLQTKASFMEQHGSLLGLIYFEFEALACFESEQRRILQDAPQKESARDGGVQNQVVPQIVDPDFAMPTDMQLMAPRSSIVPDIRAMNNVTIDQNKKLENQNNVDEEHPSDALESKNDSSSVSQRLILPPIQPPTQPDDGEIADGLSSRRREEGVDGMALEVSKKKEKDSQVPQVQPKGETSISAANMTELVSKVDHRIFDSVEHIEEEQGDHDEELREFRKIMNDPVKHPPSSQKEELIFDFKRSRAQRSACIFQCFFIFLRHFKEHWMKKSRFLALLIMPGLFVYLSWHFARYYKAQEGETSIISPDWYPLKNKILVNDQTIVGGLDTKKWVERLPMFEEAFEPTYVSTAGDEDFYPFRDAVFDYCLNEANEQPWSYGSYQFYEMDDVNHQYKFVSYVNVTSPQAANTFPQFMIESIMKTALDNDDFEIKMRQTPFPIPYEMSSKSSYFDSDDLSTINVLLTQSDNVAFWSTSAWQCAGAVLFAWIALNSVVLVSAMRDRISFRKHYQEHHGQSKLAYWIAKFCHDYLFYLPVSLVAVQMIKNFDAYMEMAPTTVMIQPFATIPFLYVCSQLFTHEATAVITLLAYQLLFVYIVPYLLVAVRLNAKTEVMGDALFKMAKVLPLESVISSFIFNTRVLFNIHRYREFNVSGKGDELELDENADMNAKADIMWIIIHCIVFWAILILLIEWQLPCFCCYFPANRIRSISDADNIDAFVGKNQDETEEEESSEIAEIDENTGTLKVRFGTKDQKPSNELAYKLEGLNLTQGGRCCWIRCRQPSQILVCDISAQIQDGSKFAIVSDGSHGKTTILNTLLSRRTAFHVAGILKKQIGRGIPVYTSQNSDVLFEDLTLMQNLDYYIRLGSVHRGLVRQMLDTFGICAERQSVTVKESYAPERHIIQLILALAGSRSTIIMDEPFTGLTRDQSLKLVKIIRQKQGCTVIVTAKSKAQIELFQPHTYLTIHQNSQRKMSQKNNDGSQLERQGSRLSSTTQGSQKQEIERSSILIDHQQVLRRNDKSKAQAHGVALEILERVRSQLQARGAKTINGLGRIFRNFDFFDGNRKIGAEDFYSGLCKIQIQVSRAEATSLISLFDTNGDGHVNFDEFLIGVRGSLNAQRQAMVDKAYLKFDADGSGKITAADLRGVYNCSMHPKFQSGQLTEDEVFLQFLANFSDKNRDGVIDRSEWNEYYAAVSSYIDNDQHFVALMKAAWQLDQQ